ncbi:MAG: UPF0158 family protein [bacterium]
MYYLPNKIKIDIEAVIDGMLNGNTDNFYFLDIKNGNVGIIETGETKKGLEKIHGKPDRYFEIPRVSYRDKEKWMKDFIKEIIPFDDIVFAKKLLKLPDDDFFENALAEIKNSKDGWIHGWNQWSRDYAYEILEDWLEKLPVQITEGEWEGYDDCAICQAMKSGNNSSSELKKAFSEQNFMNMISQESEQFYKNKKSKNKKRF